MKKFLTFCVLCISLASYAQSATPDWTVPLDGTPKAVFIHNFSGIPIAETSTAFYGINYVNKEVLWKIDKSKINENLKNASAVLGAVGAGTIPTDNPFEEIPYTPFVSISNMFADVGTGNILFGADTTTSYSSIMETEIIPEAFVLLVKARDSRTIKLFCIDLAKRELMWTKFLGKESGMKAIGRLTGFNALSGASEFTSKVTSSKDIVYKYNKTLLLLNSKDGSTIWENECNPGAFFLDNKEQYLMVVEERGGLLSSKSIGKKMLAINSKTGEKLWKKSIELPGNFIKEIQLDAQNVLIAGKEGINVYNYETGETWWKKDFEAKNLKDVSVNNEGFEVFYGNKTMLVDKTTGKKAWKKAFELDIDDEDENGVLKVEYEKGFLICGTGYVGFYDKVKGKSIWKLSVDKTAKQAFDNKNDKVAVLDGKKFYLFNPDALTKKPEKIKLDIEKHDEIFAFETRDAGYFIQGLNEYFFLNFDASVAEHKYFKQLKTDGAAKALLMAGSIASGVMSSSVTMTDGQGNSQSAGLFTSASNAEDFGAMSGNMSDARKKLQQDAKLRGASKSTNEFAYFISGEKTKEGDVMKLLKIDKNSGKEVKTFDLGNDRKIIYEVASSIDMAFVFIDGNLAAFNL